MLVVGTEDIDNVTMSKDSIGYIDFEFQLPFYENILKDGKLQAVIADLMNQGLKQSGVDTKLEIQLQMAPTPNHKKITVTGHFTCLETHREVYITNFNKLLKRKLLSKELVEIAMTDASSRKPRIAIFGLKVTWSNASTVDNSRHLTHAQENFKHYQKVSDDIRTRATNDNRIPTGNTFYDDDNDNENNKVCDENDTQTEPQTQSKSRVSKETSHLVPANEHAMLSRGSVPMTDAADDDTRPNPYQVPRPPSPSPNPNPNPNPAATLNMPSTGFHHGIVSTYDPSAPTFRNVESTDITANNTNLIFRGGAGAGAGAGKGGGHVQMDSGLISLSESHSTHDVIPDAIGGGSGSSSGSEGPPAPITALPGSAKILMMQQNYRDADAAGGGGATTNDSGFVGNKNNSLNMGINMSHMDSNPLYLNNIESMVRGNTSAMSEAIDDRERMVAQLQLQNEKELASRMQEQRKQIRQQLFEEMRANHASELSETVSAYTLEIRALKLERDKYLRRTEQMQSEVQILNDDNVRLVSSKEGLVKENERMKEEMRLLNEDNGRLVAYKDDYMKDNDRLKVENNGMRERLSAMQNRLALEESNKIQTMSCLASELDRLRDEVRAQNRQLRMYDGNSH